MSESSDEERVRLVVREMLAVDPGSEAFPDPSEIRKAGGWRWRHRIDPKVVVAVAAVVLLVATLVVAGPFRPGPNRQRVTVSNPTVTTSPPSTSPTSGLVLHIAPATNLKDGEVVQVNVSGFPPGKVFLSECGAAADVNALGCGAQLAAQPFVVIENGAGTGSFTVTHQAASTPLSPQPSTTCTNQCVLVATSGVPASGTRHIQTVTLAFGP